MRASCTNLVSDISSMDMNFSKSLISRTRNFSKSLVRYCAHARARTRTHMHAHAHTHTHTHTHTCPCTRPRTRPRPQGAYMWSRKLNKKMPKRVSTFFQCCAELRSTRENCQKLPKTKQKMPKRI